jgi:multiple sugar transport system ATP-binding protein
MSSVTLTGVTKRFDDVVAVDDLTLHIEDREFLVLLGPSGCGKSTVLRMIAGLEEPTAGEIRIGDRVVNDVEPKDRDLAMVFQSYALYPHMSVRGNIEFPLRSRQVPKHARAERVHDVAEMLGLTGLLDRKPSQLSGGQRQRVALARAVVRQPAAFLMDEPLSNLDAKLRAATRVELVELQRRLAATVVFVTHDQVEAMTMGHRIAILDHGALQQVGSPQDVYDHPANLFVARFIGTPPMNTVSGTVQQREGAIGLAAEGVFLPLPREIVGAIERRGLTELVVGVRPEHVVIDDRGLLSASVELVEHLGHEQHVICRLPDGQLVTVRQGSHQAAPAVKTPVALTTRAEHLHCFDAATGERVGS